MQEKTQGIKKPCVFYESRIPQPYAGNNCSQFYFRCSFPAHLQTNRKLHTTVTTSGTSQLLEEQKNVWEIFKWCTYAE